MLESHFDQTKLSNYSLSRKKWFYSPLVMRCPVKIETKTDRPLIYQHRLNEPSFNWLLEFARQYL
jgi:hypothetical protein